MAKPVTRCRGAALVLVAALALGAAGCSGNGEGRSLPSAGTTPERTATGEPDRTTRPTTTRETQPEKTQTQPEKTQPEKTQPPEKTQAPEKTQTPEKTKAAETTQPTEKTGPTSASASVAAVAVSDTGSSGNYLGWLLLFLAMGGLIAVLLINRSRRVAAWDAQGAALTTETRSVTDVRLPPVLSSRAAEDRALSWPPVRDDLAELATRWANLAASAPDGARQAGAGETSAVLADLVPAIDAENQALAAGRDWLRLRSRVDAILDALATSMMPQPAPGAPPQPTPYPA